MPLQGYIRGLHREHYGGIHLECSYRGICGDYTGIVVGIHFPTLSGFRLKA